MKLHLVLLLLPDFILPFLCLAPFCNYLRIIYKLKVLPMSGQNQLHGATFCPDLFKLVPPPHLPWGQRHHEHRSCQGDPHLRDAVTTEDRGEGTRQPAVALQI